MTSYEHIDQEIEKLGQQMKEEFGENLLALEQNTLIAAREIQVVKKEFSEQISNLSSNLVRTTDRLSQANEQIAKLSARIYILEGYFNVLYLKLGEREP